MNRYTHLHVSAMLQHQQKELLIPRREDMIGLVDRRPELRAQPAPQASPPVEEEERGKAALTELFEDAKNSDTPIMVERVVNDIDQIVRIVRFNGWQDTHAGEREVKKALRKTLFKYQLHQDTDLFERAYRYIEEYY